MRKNFKITDGHKRDELTDLIKHAAKCYGYPEPDVHDAMWSSSTCRAVINGQSAIWPSENMSKFLSAIEPKFKKR